MKILDPSEVQMQSWLKNGTAGQMELLYDACAPRLFGLILQITQSRAIAEKVLLEAFVRIRKERNSYDSTTLKLFTWMAGIAIRTATQTVAPPAAAPAQAVSFLRRATREYRNRGTGQQHTFEPEAVLDLLS
jgi:DNA-directed RNA polymerase specialized sigma24 family protein